MYISQTFPFFPRNCSCVEDESTSQQIYIFFSPNLQTSDTSLVLGKLADILQAKWLGIIEKWLQKDYQMTFLLSSTSSLHKRPSFNNIAPVHKKSRDEIRL